MQVLSRVESLVLGEACAQVGHPLLDGVITRGSASAVISRIRSALPDGAFRARAMMHLLEVLYSSEMSEPELRSAATMVQELGSCNLVITLLSSGVSAEDALDVCEKVLGRTA